MQEKNEEPFLKNNKVDQNILEYYLQISKVKSFPKLKL